MIKLSLPFWLSGVELTKLKAAAQAWWEQVEGWLRWPLLQLDPTTCHPTILDLLAWQRDITRFKSEPEALYRLRVTYAFVNAVDAGSTAGFKRIMQRLGVGAVEIRERLPYTDWDVVQIHVSDEQLAATPTLLDVLVGQYGRTCRRYEFVATSTASVCVAVAETSIDHGDLIADTDHIGTLRFHIGAMEINLDQLSLVAAL